MSFRIFGRDINEDGQLKIALISEVKETIEWNFGEKNGKILFKKYLECVDNNAEFVKKGNFANASTAAFLYLISQKEGFKNCSATFFARIFLTKSNTVRRYAKKIRTNGLFKGVSS